MLITRYSPSTRTSYPLDIDYGDNLPSDVVEVPLADYEAAIEARASGGIIELVDGKLKITPAAAIPFAILSAPFMAEVRTKREVILNRLAGIGMAALINGDTGTAAAVVATRRSLLDITTYHGVVTATTMDELRAAVATVYAAVIASTPETMRTVFNSLDI